MTIELIRADRFSFSTGIMDLAVRSNGQQAYTACMDGIYELTFPELPPIPGERPEAGKEEKSKEEKLERPKPKRIGRHSSYVSGIAILESDDRILSTAYDGTLQFRRLRDLQSSLTDSSVPDPSNSVDLEIAPFFNQRIHPFWSWRMALSPDKRFVASVTGQYLAGAEDYSPLPSAEPTVKLFDSESGDLLHAMNMLPTVQCVGFDPTSQFVAAGNLMGDLAVWEVRTGKQLAHWRSSSFTSWGIIKSHCYIGGVFAVAFSPDSQSLYAAGMGDMRDPMAGNGKQLWQRFDWRNSTAPKTQEIAADQAGEGLMETLAWHPSGENFLMAGRLRGGKWNVGIFAAETGQLIGQAKTGMRVCVARFSPDGKVLYLAGMQGQPAPKENRFPEFGFLERYHINTRS